MVGANLLAPKLDFGSANTRQSLNVRGRNQRNATTNRQYIYGEVKAGGTIVYMGTSDKSGNDNAYLHMVLVHCDHEVEELGDLYVNGEKVAMASGGEGVLRTTSSTYNRFYESLYIADHLGGPNQTSADSTLDAATGDISNSDAFKGMAYTYIRMELKQPSDANPDEENAFPSGVPQFQRVIKGMKVYDPRETGHSATDSTTWEYSSNWALCVAHFLQSDFGYGRYGLTYDEINSTELIASANNSDDEINELWPAWQASETFRLAGYTRSIGSWLLTNANGGISGTTQPDLTGLGVGDTVSDGLMTWTLSHDGINTGVRYELNGMVDSHEDPIEVLRKMKTAASGMVEYVGGEWIIRSGRYIAPTVTLNESDFASGISGTTKDDRTSAVNTVRGVIADKLDSYQVIDVPSITNSAFVTEDGGVESVREMELMYTNSHKVAQRLFKIELNKARQSITHKASFTSKAMQLQVGDTFQLNFAKYGYTNKVFEVWSHQLVISNGALQVEMEFRETATNIYSWDHTTDETALDPSPNTTLPSPFTVPVGPTPTVTSGTGTLVQTADGTILPTMHVSWTPASDINVIGYDVRYEKTAGVYKSVTINGRESSSTVFGGVLEFSTYPVEIRCITPLKIGLWGTATNHQVAGKSVPPTAPAFTTTNPSPAIAIVEGVQLNMVEHPDVDFKQFLIYENTTNSKPSPHSYTTTDTTKTITGLTAGQQYFFWLEAEDTTGHTTAAASNATATPTATDAADVTNLGALATEDTVDLTTTGNGGVTGVLPTGNTDATDNGTTIDTSGNVTGGITVSASTGVIQSANYSTGSAGWQIDGDGNAELNDATIRGDLVAGTIDIGASSDSLAVNSSGVATFGPTSSNSHIKVESDPSGGTSIDLYNTTATEIGSITAQNGQQGGLLEMRRGDQTHSVSIDGGSGTIYSTNTNGSQASFVVRNSNTSPTKSFTIGSHGELGWATGSSDPAAADTNLYRSAANTLKTDDSIIVGTDLTLNGRLYDGSAGSGTSGQVLSSTGSGTQWIDSAAELWTQSGSDIYYNAGSVGIGAVPTAPLQVQADAIAIKLDGSSNTTRSIFFRNTTSSNPAQIFSDGSLRLFTEDSGTDIRFHTNSNGSTNERLRIDSSGNVGIGTSSPAKMLHIESTAGNQLRLAYNSSYYWDIEREASTGDLTFTDVTSGEIMRLDSSSGNVGIGTTNTSSKLNVNGGVGVAAADGNGYRFWASNGTSYGIHMSSQGNSTWGGRLDATSDYNMYFRMSGGTNRGFVFQNGSTERAQITGAGEFFSTNLYTSRPSDAWTTNTTWIEIGQGGTGDRYGTINTGGSYAVTFNGNGYRNSSGTWTSLLASPSNYTGATQIWQKPTGEITFNTASSWTTGSSSVVTERGRFDNAGRFMIGTTSSGGYKFRVNGSARIEDTLVIGDTGSEGGEIQLLDQNNSNTNRTILDVDAAGNGRMFNQGNGSLKLGNLTGGTGETQLYQNGLLKVRVKATQVDIADDLIVAGAVEVEDYLDVTGTKNFRIAHPVREGHDLRHTCVESPQADLTYRGKATLVDGTVQVDLDSEFGMTSGTFAALNDDVQVFVQNDTGWDAVRGSVTDGVLTITCYNLDSYDSVGWLVIGRRTGITLEIEPETKIK